MTLAGLVSGVTFRMKLKASKTKTMIVSRSHTMHPYSPPLTIGRTLLKESDDLVVLGVTFESKITFEKHLRSVSRAASQVLGILRKSWWALHFPFWNTVLQCGARLMIHTLNLDRAVSGVQDVLS